eukprot:m.187703 g.187703  ORF g.187703 m.187703 type:complete len:148 (+) comp39368_c1_seq5:120-563(+)
MNCVEFGVLATVLTSLLPLTQAGQTKLCRDPSCTDECEQDKEWKKESQQREETYLHNLEKAEDDREERYQIQLQRHKEKLMESARRNFDVEYDMKRRSLQEKLSDHNELKKEPGERGLLEGGQRLGLDTGVSSRAGKRLSTYLRLSP